MGGFCRLDYIMRFENIDVEFKKLCDWIGLEEPPKLLHFHLQKHKYQEIKQKPYWEYYTDEMVKATMPFFDYFAKRYNYEFGK